MKYTMLLLVALLVGCGPQVGDVEPVETSEYVGHFTRYTELRRVNDLEMGVVCYKVTYNDGLSCVKVR